MDRREDIDQLRGIAILLMVMVHAAATWAPSEASTTSLADWTTWLPTKSLP